MKLNDDVDFEMRQDVQAQRLQAPQNIEVPIPFPL